MQINLTEDLPASFFNWVRGDSGVIAYHHMRKNTPREMYWCHRFFVENHVEAWCPIVYVASIENFYQWCDGHWEIILKPNLLSKIALININYFGSTTNRWENDILRALMSFFPIHAFTQDRSIIAFADCGLQRDKLADHEIEVVDLSPQYMITEYIPHAIRDRFEAMPKTFSEEYVYGNLEKHPFANMLSYFFEEDLLRQMIYGFIAEVIDTGPLEEWIFLLQSREGGTGKGTLTRILQAIATEEFWLKITEVLMRNSFLDSFLMNKKVYLYPETSKDAFKRELLPILKSYSGGDPASANIKHVKFPVNFYPQGVFFISTNDTPHLPPSERAIWRRLVILKMPNTPPIPYEVYVPLMAAIMEQLSDLIAWCTLLIPHKRDLHQRYLKVHDPEKIYEEITDEPEWDYFSDMIEVGTNEDFVEQPELYDFFKIYLQSREAFSNTSVRGFGRMLGKWIRDNRFVVNKRSKMVKGERFIRIYGLRMNTDFKNELEEWDVMQQCHAAECEEQ